MTSKIALRGVAVLYLGLLLIAPVAYHRITFQRPFRPKPLHEVLV